GEVIPATGHTTEIQNAKDATCTEDGYTGDAVCTVCGETITSGEVIPATGHTTEIQNAKDATCTEDGYTGDEVCTVCGETITAGETIPATGHTAGEAVVENNVAATCTETGSYDSVVYCTACNEELSRETVTVPATGHSYEATEVVAPTYTDQGYTVYTCSGCGDSYHADYTDILVLDEADESLDIRQKVESLTTLPEGLAHLYADVEELRAALISQVTIKAGYTENNTAVYDVTLQYRVDNGAWVDATEDNFPLSGITVTLPYPEGTDSSYEFNVVHMFTVTSERLGIKAGDTETPAITKTEDGLVVTLTGLSPIAISWKAVKTAETETKTTETSSKTDNTTDTADTSVTSADSTTCALTDDTSTSDKSANSTVSAKTSDTDISVTSADNTASALTGDNSRMVLWLVLLLISGVGVSGITAYHTKRKRSR
ncbi:MAG: hypothetical protein LUD01_03400, partial [Clostridiales bacterium]|nr:hypothetical protein [Clostridiales bacterium]